MKKNIVLDEITSLVFDGGVYDEDLEVWHTPETVLLFRGYDQEKIDHLIKNANIKIAKLFPDDEDDDMVF